MHDDQCPNCGKIITEKFCGACGNPKFRRLHLSEIFRDFISNLFSLEGQLLHTIKELFIRPGFFIQEYVKGKRVDCYRPFQYYLLMITLYYLVYVFFGDDLFKYMQGQFYEPIDDPNLTTNQAQTYQELSLRVSKMVNDNMKLFTFIQIPIWSLLLHDLYSKKYNYSEVLVFTLFVLGHSQLIDLLTFPFIMIFSNGFYVSTNVVLLTFLLIWASNQFFDVSWIKSILNSIYVVIIGVFVMGICAIWLTIFLILETYLEAI